MRIVPRPLTALVLIALAAGAYGYWHGVRGRSSRSIATPRAAMAPPEPPAPPPAIVAARTEAPASATGRPARMTAAQQAGFDAWLVKTYLQCWKPARQPADADVYIAQVRLAYNPDGSLMKPPRLVNPPSDPALKPQAKSVMAAVESCNPLPVPAQYRPFYEQWKTKTIHFDPQVAAR
jgi:colicin import membrane protein